MNKIDTCPFYILYDLKPVKTGFYIELASGGSCNGAIQTESGMI